MKFLLILFCFISLFNAVPIPNNVLDKMRQGWQKFKSDVKSLGENLFPISTSLSFTMKTASTTDLPLSTSSIASSSIAFNPTPVVLPVIIAVQNVPSAAEPLPLPSNAVVSEQNGQAGEPQDAPQISNSQVAEQPSETSIPSITMQSSTVNSMKTTKSNPKPTSDSFSNGFQSSITNSLNSDSTGKTSSDSSLIMGLAITAAIVFLISAAYLYFKYIRNSSESPENEAVESTKNQKAYMEPIIKNSLPMPFVQGIYPSGENYQNNNFNMDPYQMTQENQNVQSDETFLFETLQKPNLSSDMNKYFSNTSSLEQHTQLILNHPQLSHNQNEIERESSVKYESISTNACFKGGRFSTESLSSEKKRDINSFL